jgi:hypothetical protein
MSTAKPSATAKSIVDDVFGRALSREIWTANYEKALPVTVQDFDLTAVLPAVFYMFRFGYRRGKGNFLPAFANEAATSRERKRLATIERIASVLAQTEEFGGFDDEITKAVLADLLLCFCLENSKRALGRQEQVQRVAAAHYMASWVDLPESVANLRFVPEMIVAMLSDQKGEFIEQNRDGDRTWFAVGRGFEDNVLLRAFHQGVTREGPLGDRTADRFREEASVGLDQLLMIRFAQRLAAAPDKLRGGEGERISNQHPVAEAAAEHFSEDIRRFVRSYADVIPRHAFVELLEACMAIGLTTIVTSTIEVLFGWSHTGELRRRNEQRPTPLFVDCSNGIDRNLRAVAEQSVDDLMRRIEYFPVVLMALRLLDVSARFNPVLKRLTISTKPYAGEWLNFLGDLLFSRRSEAERVLDSLDAKAAELSDRLEEDYPDAASLLRNDNAEPNPVWRLAEALTFLQGRKNAQNNIVSLLDSALLIDRPNGIATRRAVMRTSDTGARRRTDLRSLVLTDAALDYLVHVHVLKSGNKHGSSQISLKEFLRALHDRYGFCIDEPLPGLTISNELLRLNRVVLERRLRDLGLLLGVNDADAMKRLSPRFARTGAEADDLE